METTVNAKFERMMNLEWQVRTNHALAVMGSDLKTRWRGEDNLKTSKRKLYALLDALTPEEAAAYSAYRKR